MVCADVLHLTRCQPQKFVRRDLHQNYPQIILFLCLVKLYFPPVILADFQRIEIWQLYWLIGLQEIGLTLPLQHFSAGILSRIETEHDRIRHGRRFGDLLDMVRFWLSNQTVNATIEHHQQETSHQPVRPFIS